MALILALLLSQIRVLDEGVTKGMASQVNCTGTGVTCTVNPTGVIWTLDVTGGGGGAPTTVPYWTGAADATLSAEHNLGALGTGLVLNTGGTPSIYAGATCGAGTYASAASASGVLTCATPEGTYTLPTASAVTLGGVKVGDRLSIAGDVLSADVQSTSPGGATTQVQFNDAGAFGGIPELTYNKVPNTSMIYSGGVNWYNTSLKLASVAGGAIAAGRGYGATWDLGNQWGLWLTSNANNTGAGVIDLNQTYGTVNANIALFRQGGVIKSKIDGNGVFVGNVIGSATSISDSNVITVANMNASSGTPSASTFYRGDGTWSAASGSGAPTTATYITQTPDAGLSAEQALSSLSTGIVKNTTTTGVLSIAVAGDFPTLNQSTTGNASTATALSTAGAASQFWKNGNVWGQPAFTDISGAAAAAQIPAASTTLGGVKMAAACGAGNHVASIGAGGELGCTADSGGSLSAATATVLGGIKGTGTAIVCSGTDKMTGWAADGTMQCGADAGAGGAPNYVEVDVDFGASGDNLVTKVVTGQAWVSATSKITCAPTMLATSTRSEGDDDAVIERLSSAIHTRVAGTGFSLTVMPSEGVASGVFKFHCVGG